MLTHAALKWFHSFIPGIISNSLDGTICYGLPELEAVKHGKPVVSKKEPIPADIIKKSLINTLAHRAPVAQLIERRAVMREVMSSTLAGPSLRVLK